MRDLSDPAQGPHAIQLVLNDILAAARGTAELQVVRGDPVVSVEDNYTDLGYPPDAITRDARYTRYLDDGRVLRSHTSAMIPPSLRGLAARNYWSDVLLGCTGVVYRRDAVDRIHTGTPHQLDLWRISRGEPRALEPLVDAAVRGALPGATYRTIAATHPYTEHGLQVDVWANGQWVEIAECGYAARHVLAKAGLPENVTGLAMGLGLDRLVMLRKGITDIRLLSATDPRIADQMLDLKPYRPVSKHPPVSRDLSVAVDAAADDETLGDLVRTAVGDLAEEIRVLSETPVEELPPAAVQRLGALPGQKNVLLRVVLRDLSRTLSDDEANEARDAVYAAVHRGTVSQWSSPGRGSR
jgi:phenylalanyl-tRNA synthetase alpha chain